MSVAANTAQVKANHAALYELERAVMDNKFTAYEERAQIEENRALIMKNYVAAFHGNRQMANMNTDGIFHNREAILSSLKVDGAVQENFVNSKINEAKVEFLDHRSKLTSRVVSVSEKLSKINHLLIEVNHDIMEGNQEVVAFNAANIATNSSFLDNGALKASEAKATPESNAERIKSNTDHIKEITARAKDNKRKMEDVLGNVKRNRADILKNADVIYERRAEIEKNHANMSENAHKIAGVIASS